MSPTLPQQIGEHAVRELLHGGDVDLETLSDEELAVVTPSLSDDQRLVPLQNLACVAPEERAAALRAAARSLLARGLISLLHSPSEGGPTRYDVHGDLATVLGAMSTFSALVVLEQHLRTETGEQPAGIDAPSLRVLYRLLDVAVVEHAPDGGGLHHFALRTPRRAAAELAGALDPDGHVPDVPASPPLLWRADGADPGWDEVAEAVGSAALLSRVVARRRGDDPGAHPLEVTVAQAGADVWLLVGLQAEDGVQAVKAQRATRAVLDGVAWRCLNPGPASAPPG